MCEVHHQFKRFVTKRLQGQDDVINQQIPVGLADLVPPRYVVKYRIPGFACARLIELVYYISGYYDKGKNVVNLGC